ncbi:MAG: hypothetical protein CVV25_03730 [Ignavibacteriae bacterium HGW-Ignavibacteriae-4]|nr:MAG: hypothetical protein CVV25_03730 [Ignavibacteriae bacterium HGW-Ignavibacteriae-4]
MKKKPRVNKSIVGAILLAITLWAYTTLNNEYVTFVKVPLKVIMPNNRAIENPIPQDLDIEVKGKGWDIFNLLFFNTSKEISLDLSKQRIEKNDIEVGRQQILKSVRYIGNLETIDALPDNVEIRTGISGEYFVEVEPNVKIIPTQGFTLVEGPNVEPERIRIKGNNKIVSNIKTWKTEYTIINDVSNKFRVKIALQDTLESIVAKSRQSVFLFGKLEQIAERTFKDVPYTLINGKAESYDIMPKRFEVTVRGGITAVSQVERSDIELILDANEVYNTSSSTVLLKSKVKGKVKLSAPTQMYVYVFRKSNEKNMLEFAGK